MVRTVLVLRKVLGLAGDPLARIKGGRGPRWNVCQKGWMPELDTCAMCSKGGKDKGRSGLVAELRRLGLGVKRQWRKRAARCEEIVLGRRRKEATLGC